MKKRILLGLIFAAAVAALVAVPSYSGFTPLENGQWVRWEERDAECHETNSTCWEWCHETSAGVLWGTGDGCCFIGQPEDVNDRWSCQQSVDGN